MTQVVQLTNDELRSHWKWAQDHAPPELKEDMSHIATMLWHNNEGLNARIRITPDEVIAAVSSELMAICKMVKDAELSRTDQKKVTICCACGQQPMLPITTVGSRPTHAPDAIYQSTPFSPAQRIGFSSSSIRRVPTTAVCVPLLIPETRISSRQQRPASNPTSGPAQSQTPIRLSVHGWTLRTLLRSGSENVLPPKMYPWVWAFRWRAHAHA